ncbi:MAG TPA: glycosyl hydrolase family 28-related protein [bacterium]|nr:glycosyl hydrolase family 28-related protein [bacterium]HPP29892.1 glycosyl hydrolase family 28-related protein [bacterium]
MNKLKFRKLLFLCIIVVFITEIKIVAANDYTGYINVRDYGAKGDGITDDTGAIRAAFSALKGYPVQAGGVNTGSNEVVLFPPGVYKVTDSIKIPGIGTVVGVGNPFIVMEHTDRDIFTTTDAWRIEIRGLQFKGGKTHLVLKNPNLDTGMIVVENCHFNNSNGPAITDNMKSTVLYIRECHFLHCEQVLHSRTDMVTMRDCWITTRWGVNDKAVIENYSSLLLENICGVPLVGGKNLRWIDNYGWHLVAKNVRFGGEGGGFTPVYNYAKASKELDGPSILIDHSFIYALGNPAAPAAVYCIEIPNKIEIRSSHLAGIKPIIINKNIDLKKYFAGVSPDLLSFVSIDNIGDYRNEIPELLKKPVCPPEKIKDSLSLSETKKLLSQIVKKVKALEKEKIAEPFIYNGHKQKLSLSDYIDLSPDKYKWDLNDYMDGTKRPNSFYLAMAQADDDVVIMRRVKAEGNWPHILIRDVKVDIDNTPWLTWKQKDIGTPEGFKLNPAGYAVRVIHKETGTGVLLTEMHWPPFFDYRAYNLKEKFNLEGGVHTFDIRIYYLGLNFVSSEKAETARPGDYIVFDFVRLERD